MKDFPIISQATSPKTSCQVRDMQDVWDHFATHAPDPSKPKEGNPEGWRLQYLTKLQSHCGGAPLATIFPGGDLLIEFDVAFPKVKKGVHPRGDLKQGLKAYKKWRRQCRKIIEIATGAAAEKADLRARNDGWSELLAAIKLHCTDGGIIRHPASAGPVTTLADIARRADIEPWNLADDGVLAKMESEFIHPGNLQKARSAQRFLNKFSCLPEIAAVLPTQAVLIYPIRREYAALPSHIGRVSRVLRDDWIIPEQVLLRAAPGFRPAFRQSQVDLAIAAHASRLKNPRRARVEEYPVCLPDVPRSSVGACRMRPVQEGPMLSGARNGSGLRTGYREGSRGMPVLPRGDPVARARRTPARDAAAQGPRAHPRLAKARPGPGRGPACLAPRRARRPDDTMRCRGVIRRAWVH